MKYLVTGGAGFIGSNFVRYLKDAYPESQVTVLDKLTYAGNQDNLKGLDIEFIKADICDQEACQKSIENADVVVHFAAESHVTRSESEPEVFEKTNVEGTQKLLELAAETNLEKFIHISTDEVYGEAEDGHFFQESEKQPGDAQATSAYAKSKARADDLAQEFMDQAPINIVRPTNNFGPYQHPEKMLPRSITRVLDRKPIALWGEGEEIRDWLYAPDTAEAIDLIIQKAPAGETYNVGANNQPEIKNRDLAHWLMGRLHSYLAEIKHVPDPREHHDSRYGVDTSKIQELGWQPSGDPWEQFDETVEWYIDHISWWQPLVEEAEKIYK